MSGLMRVSRAAFLRTCAATVAARGLDPLAVFAMPAAAPEVDSAAGPFVARTAGQFSVGDATPAMFRPHVGTLAAVTAPDGTRTGVRLATVNDTRQDGPYEQFAITFHGSADAPLPEGTYPIDHAALGRFELFIAPVGRPTGRRTVYEACFTRHLPGGRAHLG